MKNKLWLPYILLTLTVLFWSGNFILGRGVRELIPPVSLNFWRWIGAFIILLPFGIPRVIRGKEIFISHWKMLALMSIPSIAIFNAFIYTALQTATAINTSIVNAMLPIFIALTAWMIFGERMTLRQCSGVFISLTGLIFIVTRGNLNLLRDFKLSGGDLWTLGAGLAWAFYSIMLRKRPKEMDPIAFLTVIIGFGLIFSLPFYFRELRVIGGFSPEPVILASLAYAAVFPSVLSFIFWNFGVDRVGANRAGIFIHLMPVFSILMAIIFLDEKLQFFHGFGIFLIFTGIILTTLPSGSGKSTDPIK